MFTLQNLSSTGNFYITQVNILQPSDVYFKYVTLLLHGDGTNGAQNNTFIDSSSNAFTITRNGTPTQGSVSPFGPDWSNSFNGTTDYLRASSTIKTTYDLNGYIDDFRITKGYVRYPSNFTAPTATLPTQ